MPILDQSAEALLKNNTRRREGISDIPKNYGEALKAKPGYGLPNVQRNKKIKQVETRATVEVLTPKGEMKRLPVATIARKNMSSSYDFGSSCFGKVNHRKI